MSASEHWEPLGIAPAHGTLYALRNDGAVFVLRKRGDLELDGTVVTEPHWALVPPIPGTLAAAMKEG